jgi:hypothetical protein
MRKRKPRLQQQQCAFTPQSRWELAHPLFVGGCQVLGHCLENAQVRTLPKLPSPDWVEILVQDAARVEILGGQVRTHPRTHSFSLFLILFLPHSLSASFSLSLILFLPHPLSASFSFCLILSQPHSLSASFSLCLILFLPHSLSASFSFCLILSQPHSLSASFSLCLSYALTPHSRLVDSPLSIAAYRKRARHIAPGGDGHSN